MTDDEILRQTVVRYVNSMPVALMIEMVREMTYDYFSESADDDELNDFLLEFGPDNTPKGAH